MKLKRILSMVLCLCMVLTCIPAGYAAEDSGTAEQAAADVFGSSTEWDATQQGSGILTIPSSDGDSGWIETARKDYTSVDLRLTLQDQCTSDDNFRAAVRLYFANDQYVSFTLTNDRSNEDEPTVYELQNMGGTILNWATLGYTLSAEQVAQLQSEAGLEFRVVRVANIAHLYLGGTHVYECDLGEAVADQTTSVLVRCYGNTGKTVNIPFALYENAENASLSITAGENGTVTADRSYYLAGETVSLSVAGAAGYAHDSLTVNGQAVQTDLSGKYSFTAQAENTVTATFKESLFKSTVSGWLLENQHYGSVAVSYANANGNSNWLDLAKSYTNVDITLSAREYEDASKPDLTRSAIRFTFPDSKIITFSIAKNIQGEGHKYSIQSLSGDSIVAANYDFYVMNDAQIAKFNSAEGIDFRVVRQGTEVDIYLDGVQVVDGFDLTQNESGVTADTEASLAIRRFDDPGIQAEYGITVSDTLPQAAVVNVDAQNKGTVTTDKDSYIVGEKVTVTVTAGTGYARDTLTVNGQLVTMDENGSYTFTALAQNTVTAAFRTVVFGNSAEWDNSQQESGILKIPASDGDSGWIETNRKDYTDVDFRLTLRDQANADDNFRAAVRLYFSNEQYVSFTLTNDRSNEDETTVYELQTMGGTMLNWKYLATLTAEQVAQLTGGEGLEFRVVRVENMLYVYAGGVRIYEYDMTGAVSNETCSVVVRCYGNSGKDVEIPFSLSEDVKAASLNISAGENGTVTADQTGYFVGDTVILSVTGAAGYAHDSLTVNGQAVQTDLSGKYTFTAQAENTVTATFKESLFKSTVSGWLLENQHYGSVAVSYANANGNSNWLDFAKSYTDVDITLTAREYEDASKPDLTRSAIRFVFPDSKIITFSIAKNIQGEGHKYSIQSLSGDSIVAANYDFYVMNDAQIAKFNSAEGIDFRVVRQGTEVDIYLDGVQVVDGFDLTQNESGITADTEASLTIRRYDDPGIQAEYGIAVSELQPQTAVVTVDPAPVNGTVTTDKESYIVGEKVTVTVAGAAGYAHDSLTVNGQAVQTDLSGKYTFTAQAENTVTATFKESLFKSSVSGWLLENQHYGSVALTYTNANGNSNWLDFANTYGDVDITLTAREYEDTSDKALTRSAIRLTFTNGKIITFSIAKNADGEGYMYSVQALAGDTIVNGNYHFYMMDADQIAKFNSAEGIDFRVVRQGTEVDIYLDGVLVVDGFDLTQNESGVTADMAASMAIRRFDDPGIQAEYGIQVTGQVKYGTVYVSASGDDTAAGTQAAPVATLAAAMQRVDEGGTIVLVDTLTAGADFVWPSSDMSVTVTGGTMDLSALSGININSAVTFDNVTLTVADNAEIYCNGNKVKICQNVTVNGVGYIFGGGANGTTVESTDLTVLAGTYIGIYGGGAGAGGSANYAHVTGATNLVVGGSVNPDIDVTDHDINYHVYGGCRRGTVGTTNVTVEAGAKVSKVYGGGSNSSDSGAWCDFGTTNVTVNGGTIMGVYGGNAYGPGKSGCQTNITVNGGTIEQIFGGHEWAHTNLTGDVSITLNGGTVTRRVYGGCYNNTSGLSFSTDRHVVGNITLTIAGGVNIDFSSSSSDRSIYAHSRYAGSPDPFADENATLIFADQEAYDKYADKLTAQDGTMQLFMGDTSAADNIVRLYKVTYVADGQTVAEYTVQSGSSVAEVPAVPGKTGYTGAWDHDGTNITADTTISAVYTANASIDSWSLTLGDDIGVNFYATITDAANTVVNITVNGETTTVNAAEAEIVDGKYAFRVNVAAAQMMDTITVELTCGQLSIVKEVTVRQYADEILSGDYDDAAKALVKEMLNYGAAAQTYFGYNTESLANDGIEGAGSAAVPATAETDVSVSGSDSGITYYGATLVFGSKTAVRFYFDVTGDISGYTFTVGQTAYTPVEKDGRYYVEIADINPQDLDKAITLSVGGLSVTYAPMNYMVNMSASGSENLRTLLKAMYNYHLAAAAYTK